MAERELTPEEAAALGIAPEAEERELTAAEARELGIEMPAAEAPVGRQPFPGSSARDIALAQGPDTDPSAPTRDTATSRGLAVGLGAAQGATFGQFKRVMADPFFGDPDMRIGRTAAMAAQKPIAEAGAKAVDKAESDRPGEFLAGEVVGSLVAPGPKIGAAGKAASVGEKLLRVAGKAGVAAGEGALYAEGTGGDAKTGAGVGAGASLAGSTLGKVGRVVRDRLAARVAKPAAEVAAAAAGPAAPVHVVRVMSKDGKNLVAVGSVEKMEDGVATVYAGGKRMQVPAERLQTIKVKAPITTAPKGKAPKVDPKPEDGQEKLLSAVADKVMTAGAIGVPTLGGVASAIDDPAKAAERGLKGIGLGIAGAVALKGRRAGMRLVEKAASASQSEKLAARVAKALAGRAARGARRVGVAETEEALR